jgi:ribosomal protein S18 acetylase RimI-like enzyme
VTEEASAPVPRRPATARRRTDPNEHEGMAPPSPHELAAIEQSQLDWARLMEAEVLEDPELGATIVRHHGNRPDFNLTARANWPAREVAQRLELLRERMEAEGAWPSLVISEGISQPNDLAQRVEAAGWKQVRGERIMFTRHAPVIPHVDAAMRVEAVTKASAIDGARLEAEAFGQPVGGIEARAELLAHAVETGAIRGFLLRLVREPVATLRLTPGDRVAGIHGVAVGAKHRRRGYGRMITAVATRAGLATGHGLVWLSVDEANTAAYELYRSLGYEPTFAWSRWLAPDR